MQYTEEAIKKRKSQEKNIRKKLNTFIYILLIPLLVYNLSLIIQAILKPNETPSVFGIKMYVIISGSMKPELDIGDIVIVKEVNQEDLKKGDIISYRQGHTVVTHRIDGIVSENNEDVYRTKGDSNNTEDSKLVTYENIEGKVIYQISSLGNIVLALRNKTLIIVIVLFYYIFLMQDQSIQKRKNKRRLKREKYEERKKENEK